jgi:Putative prokaryotic signal transducing protein
MRELILTTDPVLLSFVQSLLQDAGIEALVFDQHISIVEGSIGAFPRRLMVPDVSWDEAARLMREAGIGEWIAGSEKA